MLGRGRVKSVDGTGAISGHLKLRDVSAGVQLAKSVGRKKGCTLWGVLLKIISTRRMDRRDIRACAGPVTVSSS
jgi:hypothetical protein